MKVTHIGRRSLLRGAAALGLAAAFPPLAAPVTGAYTPAPADYTPEIAADFARIWLAGGATVPQMRAFAVRLRSGMAAMRADAAAALIAGGFDPAAYAAELGITGGAR